MPYDNKCIGLTDLLDVVSQRTPVQKSLHAERLFAWDRKSMFFTRGATVHGELRLEESQRAAWVVHGAPDGPWLWHAGGMPLPTLPLHRGVTALSLLKP